MKLYVFLHVDTDTGGADKTTYRGVSLTIKDVVKFVHPSVECNVSAVIRSADRDAKGKTYYTCKDRGESYILIYEEKIDDLAVMSEGPKDKPADLVSKLVEAPDEEFTAPWAKPMTKLDIKPEVRKTGLDIETPGSKSDTSISIKFGG
jgi:hypothetical protein